MGLDHIFGGNRACSESAVSGHLESSKSQTNYSPMVAFPLDGLLLMGMGCMWWNINLSEVYSARTIFHGIFFSLFDKFADMRTIF